MAWSHDERMALLAAMENDPVADQLLQFGSHRDETHRAVLLDSPGYILWAMAEQQPGPCLQRLLRFATQYCQRQGARLAVQIAPVQEPAPEEPAQEERAPLLPRAVQQLRELMATPLEDLNRARVWANTQRPDDMEAIHRFLHLLMDLHD